jgi:fatty-acyl-CoA synthase
VRTLGWSSPTNLRVLRRRHVRLRRRERPPRREEAAIVDHPAVQDAVVFGVPDERLGTVPGVVVVATRSLTASDPVACLDAHVTEHAVSTTLEVVEKLPREGPTAVD